MTLTVLNACIVTASGVLASAAQAAAVEDSYLQYSGTAVDKSHPEQRYYGEIDELLYHNGILAQRVVLYTCTDGEPFARKIATYDNLFAPDFTLSYAGRSRAEGVRVESGKRIVFSHDDKPGAERTALLPAAAGLVADTGFDEFVHTHWQQLLAGQTIALPFLVPSRLKAMDFAVEHIRSDRLDGVAVEVFRLRVAGFIGAILPSIEVWYSTENQELLRYAGLSDIRDAAGKNLNADIRFPRAARHVSDARAFAQARDEPLAPCSP